MTAADPQAPFHALGLDTRGWRRLDWDEALGWHAQDGLLWVHLQRESDAAAAYLEHAGLDPLVRDALVASETRPRAQTMGDGLLLLLRGVNLNPGADPEDMVSLRLWVEEHRIVSLRMRPTLAVQDLRTRMLEGSGPRDSADFVVQMSGALAARMSNVIEDLDDTADALETSVVDRPDAALRTELARLRQQTITLRRYLAPQRDALSRVQEASLSWLQPRDRARLREVNDRVIRYVEDLDAIRERAAVVQDEVLSRLSDRMNRNMYLLTLVATVMLPLGFFTGLLGVNVDGIPGAQNTPWAFGALCAGLGVLAGAMLLFLKRLGWF